MIGEGSTAPTFRLSGASGSDNQSYRLQEALRQGSVLLAFASGSSLEEPPIRGPLAYVPWFQFTDDVRVWLLTDDRDSTWSDRATGEFAGVSILTDADESVAAKFEVEYGDGHLVLVDPSRTVRFVSRGTDALESGTIADLRRTIESIHQRETRRTKA